MNKIIKGWLNWLFPSRVPTEAKELFDARLSVCERNECGKLKMGICTECGCPVKAKTKVFTENCPLNMWAPTHQEYEGITYVDLEEVPDKIKVLFIRKSNAFTRHPDLPYGFIELKEWESFMQWCDDNYTALASSTGSAS